MRIGIVLRSIDENQGIGIYTRNLVASLLGVDQTNEYVLVYRTPRHFGRFAKHRNAREVLLRLPVKLVWDQVGIPALARKFKLDLIFHPKFTVPLLSGRPVITMMHGVGWFTHPEDYSRAHTAAMRILLPLYCRKAAHLLSNSQSTTNGLVERLGVPGHRITTIPFAVNDHFKPVTDQAVLDAVRDKYRLPPRFVLSVTKYFRCKNVPSLIQAWSQLPPDLRGGLVLAGAGVERYLDDLNLRDTELGKDIVTPGWVEQSDLPALYTLADVFAFPSFFESFGIPVLEAMTCGCPVVSSRVGAIPEIAQDAGILLDPADVAGLREALRRVLSDPSLRREMQRKGLARAGEFPSWDEHARRTLEVFQRFQPALPARSARLAEPVTSR